VGLLLNSASLSVNLREPLREISQPETTAVQRLSPGAARAYAELLKLKASTCRQLLAAEPPQAPGTLLVADCADFVELLTSQDAARYDVVAQAQSQRLAALDAAPPAALRDYARAAGGAASSAARRWLWA